MRRWMVPLGTALLGCSAFAACTQESPMNQDSSIREKIVASVAQDLDWNTDDVVVQSSEALSTGQCKFYRASNRALPDAGVVHYGLPDDGALIGGANDRLATAEVLRRCGGQADATWWANVVSAFDGQAAGRPVLPEDKLSISLIASAGGSYFAPRLTTTGGQAVAEFFVIQHATQPFVIKASLPRQGPLEVVATPVR